MRSRFRRAVPVPVVLYTREGCGPCDSADAALRRAARKVPLEVDYVDIDAPDCPAAVRDAYAMRVPVVATPDGEVICEGKVSERRLVPSLRKYAQSR